MTIDAGGSKKWVPGFFAVAGISLVVSLVSQLGVGQAARVLPPVRDLFFPAAPPAASK